MSIKLCPKCNKEFDDYSKWGTKKFCSRSCANSREQTAESKEKKKIKLSVSCRCVYCDQEFNSKSGLANHKRHCISNPNRSPGGFFNKTHLEETKRKIGQNNVMGCKVPKSLLDMSKRTSAKILKRLNIGCFNCDWDLTSCDIHHIIPSSKGGSDNNENLTYLCPNCHRLAHENKLTTFVSLKERIGEEWRKYYFAHK
jgi:5-methylcytosine-specific restriction endonuclease McrA